MFTTGLIVRLEAKADQEEEVAAFLEGALPLVEREPQTLAWLAVRTGVSSFAIVDFFPDETARQAHLDGALAVALLEKANEWLSEPPEIQFADVLATKLPASGA